MPSCRFGTFERYNNDKLGRSIQRAGDDVGVLGVVNGERPGGGGRGGWTTDVSSVGLLVVYPSGGGAYGGGDARVDE